MAILAITFVLTRGGSSGGSPEPASTPTPTPSQPASKPAPTPRARPRAVPAPVLGVPLPVRRALARRDVVVLFFFRPGVADDDATRAAVAAARGESGAGVAVFTDTVDHLARYRRVVTGVGISESPALVVVDRSRQARLFEGYLDPDSVRQAIRDAE